MPNKNYVNGRRKEYQYIKLLEDNGFIAFRSAGSHSPFDVIGVHLEKSIIIFIQGKNDNFSKKQEKEIIDKFRSLHMRAHMTGFFLVRNIQEAREKIFGKNKNVVEKEEKTASQ